MPSHGERKGSWLGIGALCALLALAGTVSAAQAKSREFLRNKTTKDYIADLRFGTPELREAAIEVLSRTKDKKTGPALVEVLSDTTGTLRLKVVEALGRLQEPSAVNPLVKLLKDPDAETRSQAVVSLGQIGDPKAGPALRELLADSSTGLRMDAALAVGQCRDKGAVPELIKFLKEQPIMVKIAAADGLGYIGEGAALPALKEQLATPDASYRRHLVRAIGLLHDPAVTKLLAGWLQDQDSYLRAFSAEALGLRAPEVEAVKPLILALDDEILAVRIRAAETLGAWKVADAVVGLKKCLRDPSEVLRWKAVNALGLIADSSAAESLRYVAENDTQPEIRRAAAEALDQLSEK